MSIATIGIAGTGRMGTAVARRWAQESRAKLPVAQTVLQIYEDVRTAGLGSLDGACLARFVSGPICQCTGITQLIIPLRQLDSLLQRSFSGALTCMLQKDNALSERS